ncbi:glycosyltransferase [Marinomonas sp. FW-1]|uniref:glycosyltransferase n=1 Tax=Marinomonas sp. FW-1 TaxID=2071621 RepID=UPI0010BF80EF|nr:glycosyltransferase [Marinomonas sp. FW-1]
MSLVSIITPSYNSAHFISETIISVLNQSYTDWEMIVVDDFSNDTSVSVIQSFINKDGRIKLIQLSENSGAAIARNTAIKVASGRYIAFLDSDDLWMPDKLEKQVSFMKANEYPFCYAAYDKIDENGQFFGHVGVPDKVSYSDLLKTCSIGCLTAMYDTDYFSKVYMPTSTKREDFATWLKLLKKTGYAYGLNESLARYRVYQNQTSAKKVKMAKENWRLYRDIEGFGFIKASYYFSHYAVRGLFRTRYPRLARILGLLR